MRQSKGGGPSDVSSLGTESIPKLMTRFASFVLVGLLLNSVYSLTDTLFVSWGVGNNAIGGVSVVFPFVMIQGAISTALGGGAASIISRRLGEGDKSGAGNVAFNAMLTFYLTAILVTAVGFALMNPLLNMLGATDEIRGYAKQYFVIILAGNVFSTGFSSIIRAEGKMLYALLIWVIPISINIILDAIFILVLKWGVKGAAAATVICQFVSFLMSVIFFTRFTSLNFKGVRPQAARIGEILSIGVPSLVQIGSLSAISVLFNNVLSNISGTLGVNTFAYISKLITYAAVPFTAVAQALAPVIGYNYGAGLYHRVKKALTFSALICLFYAIFVLILAEALPAQLIRIFTDNVEIIASGAKGLRIVGLSALFIPLPMLTGAAFQATGKKLSALVMYASNLLFMLPMIFILSRSRGLNGVWWAYVIAAILSFALAALLIPRFVNNLDNGHNRIS